MRFILIFLFFCSCSPDAPEKRFLPIFLASENSIKATIILPTNFRKIREEAATQNLSMEEWRDKEKQKVTDSDINHYYQLEKKKASFGFEDTDAIDRLRLSIRTRLAWIRILNELDIEVISERQQGDLSLLGKLKLDKSPFYGKPGAKWTIIEWSDFLCTFCKQTFPATENIRKIHIGEIHWVHKDYPLDPETENGLRPLAISRCVWEKDKTKYFSSLGSFYNHATRIMHGEISGYGDCDKEGQNKKYEPLVIADYEEAMALGIRSVPSFWVNGRMIVGALDLNQWKRVLVETSQK